MKLPSIVGLNNTPISDAFRELKDAERFLASVIENSDDAIITKDLDGIVTSWNKSAERIFGYTAEEMIGKSILLLIPEERAYEEADILKHLRNGERIRHFETVRRHKDGSLIDVSITASPVKDEQGKVIGASKIARDITVRKREQNAAQFLAAIVESSDDAIITKNLQGIITSWNKGAEKIFGYTADEMIGKPVLTLIPPGRENEEFEILDKLRHGLRVDHIETLRRHKDGGLIDISLTVSPLRDSQGVITGASKIARDITRRKQTEQELAAIRTDLEDRVADRTASLQGAVAQMEEFSYSVSHDLRAPIRAMKGFACAIQDDYGAGLEPGARNYLERIIRSSDRMERLINDILIYSRVARSDMTPQPVATEKILKEVTEQFPGLQSPKVEISIQHPLLPVMAHESSLTQAVSNLLLNSAKFVAPGVASRINVWTEANNGHVRLWVQDNGIGIPLKYQHRIFGMFERLHDGKKYEGTGIGLAIVRKAVEKMGGQVGVESDGEHGSSFWIQLPAVSQN